MQRDPTSPRSETAATDPRDWAAPKPSGLHRLLPILTWLPSYDRTSVRFDLIAGATLWGLLVPESIAYAGLAGLPAQAGLYTLLATLAAYVVFGTSRHLVVAATSAAAVLLATAAASVGPVNADQYAANAAAVVLFCAGLLLLDGPAPPRVHRAVPVAPRDGRVCLRSRDLRHGEATAQALRSTEGRRQQRPAARPPDHASRGHKCGDPGDRRGSAGAAGRSRAICAASPRRAARAHPRDRDQYGAEPRTTWRCDRRNGPERAPVGWSSRHSVPGTSPRCLPLRPAWCWSSSASRSAPPRPSPRSTAMRSTPIRS